MNEMDVINVRENIMSYEQAAQTIETITQRAERMEDKYDEIEARFLLSIYNGEVFKINLNNLLMLDIEKRVECLRLLEYDTLGYARTEIHTHIQNGSERFQALAERI